MREQKKQVYGMWRLLLVLAAVWMLCMMNGLTARAETETGTLVNGLTYSYDTETKTLTLSGKEKKKSDGDYSRYYLDYGETWMDEVEKIQLPAAIPTETSV